LPNVVNSVVVLSTLQIGGGIVFSFLNGFCRSLVYWSVLWLAQLLDLKVIRCG
jgi:hypothetical protein